ncbi:MAG: hypothetical protein IT449_04305 [Phycisphaerales bacterium]|nr:hypothetical protein [Phycisphaerales bacterium]
MKRVSVQGLVRFTQHVRREIAAPLTAEGKARLRTLIERSTRVVDDLLHREGLSDRHLPAPTRAALLFLRGVNVDALPSAAESVDSPPRGPAPILRLTGLPSKFEALLDALGNPASLVTRDAVHAAIIGEHRHVERLIEHHGVEPASLHADHRNMRGWLAYLAEPAHFERYASALDLARRGLEAAAAQNRRRSAALWIHFRPMRGIYRIRWNEQRTLLRLPTPMISFDAAAFEAMGRTIFLPEGRDGAVLNRMQSAEYRSVESALEAASGAVSLSRGAVHDLTASFDRVNAAYFAGQVARPRLAWSDRVAMCKFGHYDFTRDEVQIGAALDAPHVPEFVLDSVMHHELLHKQHGLRWSNGRGHAHTPQFRADERRFSRYAEADRFLAELARRARGH